MGWSTDKNAKKPDIDDLSQAQSYGEASSGITKLYAVWKPVSSKTVTIGSNINVRKGCLEGSERKPTKTVNLSNHFDIAALKKEGYTSCKITISYTVDVDGDHLYAQHQLKFGETEIVTSEKTYCGHNSREKVSKSITTNINSLGSSISIQWFASGMSALDGLNDYDVNNAKITIEFIK